MRLSTLQVLVLSVFLFVFNCSYSIVAGGLLIYRIPPYLHWELIGYSRGDFLAHQRGSWPIGQSYRLYCLPLSMLWYNRSSSITRYATFHRCKDSKVLPYSLARPSLQFLLYMASASLRIWSFSSVMSPIILTASPGPGNGCSTLPLQAFQVPNPLLSLHL